MVLAMFDSMDHWTTAWLLNRPSTECKPDGRRDTIPHLNVPENFRANGKHPQLIHNRRLFFNIRTKTILYKKEILPPFRFGATCIWLNVFFFLATMSNEVQIYVCSFSAMRILAKCKSRKCCFFDNDRSQLSLLFLLNKYHP